MSYGDKIDFGEIKDSFLYYVKPSERSFNDNWIKFEIKNNNNWYYTLEFKNRKEWFKFVRKVNFANKKIKEKNIEKNEENNNGN